jgi:hypothetical protein
MEKNYISCYRDMHIISLIWRCCFYYSLLFMIRFVVGPFAILKNISL